MNHDTIMLCGSDYFRQSRPINNTLTCSIPTEQKRIITDMGDHKQNVNVSSLHVGGSSLTCNGVDLKTSKALKKMASEQKARVRDEQPKQWKKTSPFIGVCKKESRYTATIKSHNDKKHLGYYQLETDAAHAYDRAARILKGQLLKINFNTESDYLHARSLELERRGINTEEMDSVEATNAQIQSRISEATLEGERRRELAPPKQQTSTFIGVRDKRNSRYKATISHNNKQKHLGYYQLETDAAYAYDRAALILRGKLVNFNAESEYLRARARELEQRGISLVDAEMDHRTASDVVVRKVKKCLNQNTSEQKLRIKDKTKGKLIFTTLTIIAIKLPFG